MSQAGGLLSQVLGELSRGSVFRLYPDSSGSAQDMLVFYSAEDGHLCWTSPREPKTHAQRLPLADITDVYVGSRKFPTDARPSDSRCLSIVAGRGSVQPDFGSSVVLHLEARSASDADDWVFALCGLAAYHGQRVELHRDHPASLPRSTPAGGDNNYAQTPSKSKRAGRQQQASSGSTARKQQREGGKAASPSKGGVAGRSLSVTARGTVKRLAAVMERGRAFQVTYWPDTTKGLASAAAASSPAVRCRVYWEPVKRESGLLCWLPMAAGRAGDPTRLALSKVTDIYLGKPNEKTKTAHFTIAAGKSCLHLQASEKQCHAFAFGVMGLMADCGQRIALHPYEENGQAPKEYASAFDARPAATAAVSELERVASAAKQSSSKKGDSSDAAEIEREQLTYMMRTGAVFTKFSRKAGKPAPRRVFYTDRGDSRTLWWCDAGENNIRDPKRSIMMGQVKCVHSGLASDMGDKAVPARFFSVETLDGAHLDLQAENEQQRDAWAKGVALLAGKQLVKVQPLSQKQQQQQQQQQASGNRDMSIVSVTNNPRVNAKGSTTDSPASVNVTRAAASGLGGSYRPRDLSSPATPAMVTPARGNSTVSTLSNATVTSTVSRRSGEDKRADILRRLTQMMVKGRLFKFYSSQRPVETQFVFYRGPSGSGSGSGSRVGHLCWAPPGVDGAEPNRARAEAMPLEEVVDVFVGAQEFGGLRIGDTDPKAECCFSVGTRKSIVHIETTNAKQRKAWGNGLTALMTQAGLHPRVITARPEYKPREETNFI